MAMMTKKAGLTAAASALVGSRMMNNLQQKVFLLSHSHSFSNQIQVFFSFISCFSGVLLCFCRKLLAPFVGNVYAFIRFELFDGFADCFCILKIVDESYPKPGLSVNLFAEHFGMLPLVASFGDIILLSHVMVTKTV